MARLPAFVPAALRLALLVAGAVALAAGLAFGLGNTKLAGEVTRRWYEEGRARWAQGTAGGDDGTDEGGTSSR